MWVVKLGGSMAGDALLPQWLQVLAELGGGRVTVVCGGGGFADEARRLQKRWRFDDLTAHNMAVLAMVQTAYQLNALNPGLRLAVRRSDIDQVLHGGQTALWLPFELQHGQSDATTHWGHTSDSIAFDLARRLNAERLVIVKSCEIDPELGLQQLGRAGVVDEGLAALSGAVAFPIQLLHKSEVETMRMLLLHNGASGGVHAGVRPEVLTGLQAGVLPGVLPGVQHDTQQGRAATVADGRPQRSRHAGA